MPAVSYQPTEFDYSLPPELIAQFPAEPRDQSQLLIVDRHSGALQPTRFAHLTDFLTANDVIVRNNTKVLPARLWGKKSTGGKVEVLLVRPVGEATGAVWECLTKPGLKPGQTVTFAPGFTATCAAAIPTPTGASEATPYTRQLHFSTTNQTFAQALNQNGHTPLPPYIQPPDSRETTLRRQYQTIFAQHDGSVAAPTAGLHFTPALDAALCAKGVEIIEVTLHVGLGTFLPLQPEQLASGKLHPEWFQLGEEEARRLRRAKADGKRVIAVGTTTCRVLESNPDLVPRSGTTELFIRPGDRFRVVDSLITNFHLPKSSLLMLVSAFVSAPNTPTPFQSFPDSVIGQAYTYAVQEHWRFFSFGDAMWIV